MAHTQRIYNSLTRTLEDFHPAEPGQVSMYVCGMTVYDYCHIGHARAMLSFDLVYRWLVEQGLDVTFVRNYTDVDDKIIQRAAELGEDPLALSARFIEALDEDLGKLGLAIPRHQPKVSEHIDDIITLVSQLIERGHAYAVEGDVYFAVDSFPEYGKLSGKKLEDLRAGERIAVDDRKRHPADFALWKASTEGVFWDSPWGAGRPGWHIECSAMSMRYLGHTFDIHGGGIDLIFPHHENEIAQSECGTGHAPFARYWLHNGHLTAHDGEKMSKSLGNFVRIRDICAEVPAEALRLVYMESHYRSPLPYSPDRLAEAVASLDRLYQARELLENLSQRPASETPASLIASYGEPAEDLHRLCETFAERFSEAMCDDFNSARALSVLWELVRAVNRFGGLKKVQRRGAAMAAPALAAFDQVGRVMGIGGRDSAAWFEEVRRLRLAAIGKTEADIEARITARDDARQAKDYAASDAIRLELDALGVVLMDGPQGTLWRMRVE
jgi:cysteinyl-tRNA synthetase